MPSPTRAVRPLLFASALYVVAGGVVHLMQWTDGYRRIPSEVAGSWLVRDGFPLNALVSFLGAAALVWMLVRPTARLVPIVAANLTLQIGSLTLLIATRMTSVFGWSEPVWTSGANQARGVEIGALAMLMLTAAFWIWAGRSATTHRRFEVAYAG